MLIMDKEKNYEMLFCVLLLNEGGIHILQGVS